MLPMKKISCYVQAVFFNQKEHATARDGRWSNETFFVFLHGRILVEKMLHFSRGVSVKAPWNGHV
jgi:hypothetical protein